MGIATATIVEIYVIRRSRWADQESDEQAAAVAEKDGSWIEVVSKKTRDSARQCQRENQYDLIVSQQRDNTSHEARKQR